jgi:DNA-binding NarL/FixJ family response regulator
MTSGKSSLLHWLRESYTEIKLAKVELLLSVIRLYIVDEHESVRSALTERLALSDDVRIIGHTGDANRVIAEVREHKPDAVLLEVKRRDGLGLELIRQLSAIACGSRLVVLTSYPSDWEEDAACRAGAHAYLLKNIDPEELIRSISIICTAS